VKKKSVSKLEPHPISKEVYGQEELKDEFVESIEKQGILVPIKVKEDGTIISGHRRWQAAKELDFEEVPVEDDLEFSNELEEKEIILNFNEHRERIFSQKMNEAELREEIEEKKAKERMSEGGKGGPNGPPFKGRSEDKIAKQVGFGLRSLFSPD